MSNDFVFRVIKDI